MPIRNRLKGTSVALKDDQDEFELRTEGFDPHVIHLLKSLFFNPADIARLAMGFEDLTRRTLASRSPELLASDIERIEDPLWMLDEVQYMGYVNFMGRRNGDGTFETLKDLLPYVMDQLGAKVVYPLPFLSSPFGDAGFDVSDYKNVDPRFGGMREFRSFRKRLAELGGKLQMDLVLNHVSVEHDWAKRAVAGDSKYRDYFHIRTKAPDVVSVAVDSTGLPLAARYLERDEQGEEKTVERRVVFPAFADPAHPHYTKTRDALGNDIWVYHTFYPFQWDLNFTNPRVVEEALGVLAFWANEGADVLRLDAIPHLFKQRESDPRIMVVVQLLRYFLARTAPRTVLIVEANQSPEVVSKYFGDTAKIHIPHMGRTARTSTGAQVAYNFDQTIHSWASFLTGDKTYLLEGLRRTPQAPPNTLWANFLRIHDELSLSKAPDKIREIIQRELIDAGRGVPFRGARGVGGRLSNFLDHDLRRHKLAYAHLFGLEGHPIVYYGDEIMAKSDSEYARQAARDRGGAYDSRDEGRGPIAREDLSEAMIAGGGTRASEALAHTRRLVQIRRARVSLRRGQTAQVETSHSGVAAYVRRAQDGEATLVVLNLTDGEAVVRIGWESRKTELYDVISGRMLAFETREGNVVLNLTPYEALWLDV